MLEEKGPSSTARMIAAAMVLANRQGWRPSPPREEVAWCRRFLKEAGAGWLLTSLATPPGRWFWIALEFALAPGLIRHFLRRKAWLAAECGRRLGDGPAAQLVVLGAGLDALPVRTALEHPNVRVFEIEQAPIAAIRRRAVGERPNHHVLDGDLVELGQQGATFDRLRERLDPELPTVFLCEGVVMYMPRQPVQQMLAAAASLTAHSTLLVTVMDRVEGMPVGFRPYRRLVRWWLHRQGEPFYWGATKEEIIDMFSAAGWQAAKIVEEPQLAQRWPGRCLHGELLVRAELEGRP